jgi:predicted dehydrogenase
VIKAAIVGLGWWGKTLVDSAENSDVIRFTAGATHTVSPEVEAFAKQKSLRLAPCYDALLSDKDIDAVVLAVPHSMHTVSAPPGPTETAWRDFARVVLHIDRVREA